jgi:hypothetical protein
MLFTGDKITGIEAEKLGRLEGSRARSRQRHLGLDRKPADQSALTRWQNR